MDVDESGEGSAFQYLIGYTTSVGVGLLQEIRKANNLVTLGARGDVLTQYIASTLLVLGRWTNTVPNWHMSGIF